MNPDNAPLPDEPASELDRAIRAVLAEPVPEKLKARVIRDALGLAADRPGVSSYPFLESVKIMIQTHKRLSSAAAVLAVAAALALAVSLVSPSGRAYALQETARANDRVTSYHVTITPAAELGEAWVQLNPDGTPLQARTDLLSPDDGPKVVIFSKGKAEVWFKNKKVRLLVPAADALKRIAEMRNLADPKLAFERLQAEQAAGKVQVETRQPARKGDPIVLTVTSRANPDRREIYEVDPKAKLVERVRHERRKGGAWEQVSLRRYLDYNKPIDPRVFQPEIPAGVTIVDQIGRTPGLVKGPETEEEMARTVVRGFFEALIAGDYDRAGLIYEAIPGAKLKEGFGAVRFVRIVEIGQPRPAPNPLMKALQVPARVELEVQGRRQVESFSPFVRAPEGHPDRRVICGGI
jgi:hypothetical protein